MHNQTFILQGRQVSPDDIVWLQNWIAHHPHYSRKRLARELCHLWHWHDDRGRLKDFAARSFLLKLAAKGVVTLPPLQLHQRRTRPPVLPPPDWQEPAPWTAALPSLQPVQLEVVVPGSSVSRRWAFYVARYHDLGLHVVGENIGYLARDSQGRDLGCLLFGAAAWRCAPRDRFLGWTDSQRRERLAQLANNTRFLILPWVRVPHLASHLLGAVARRIDADWQAKYGHGLEWLETFVQRDRFAATCYRAANWRHVGDTTGRSRQDRDRDLRVPVKAVYLYRVRR